MNWFKPKPNIRDEYVEFLRIQIDVYRAKQELDAQRIDRLTEALARKANVDLIMPQPIPPVIEKIHVPNPWKDPNPITSTFKGETQ